MEERKIVSAGIAIEKASFQIIESEIGSHNFSRDEWLLVRRVIHSTGDFEFANLLKFHPEAIESSIKALMEGALIFADTRMIGAGLSSFRLSWFGNKVEIPSIIPESKSLAEELQITRSAAAFRLVAHKLNDAIVAIGNAPTALMEVMDLYAKGISKPSVVIGVPVGFVQAEESKETLMNTEQLPYISVKGRKGGSPVAVSILHGLLEVAYERSKR